MLCSIITTIKERNNSLFCLTIYFKLKPIIMIKKLLSVMVCCVVFYAAKSQINKGNWMVGGSGSFARTIYNSESGQKNTYYNISINSDVGFFVAAKFSTGFKVGFTKDASKTTGTNGYFTVYDFNIGPFLRYYFLPIDKQFNILADGAYQYGFVGGNSGISSYKNTFSLNVGPVIYFNSSVGLEFLIGYSTYTVVGFSGNNSTVQTSVGFHFYLEK